MDIEKDINYKIDKIVSNYFKLNNIEDLMEYGSDSDEGLYSLSSLYKDIMNELNIKYEYIYTEDGFSDGKYITTISFKNKKEMSIETKAWNGIDIFTENIKYIYDNYNSINK
ncbi:hypothetical protein H8356DRAFT_1672897 [Neocallimastix lanati (nom. inval.)]|jgi:hypothetical protein|nr:hypothetical protein H8356DRAFT_1672897 [Neocallimastix sp. JGI-2020a]